MKQFKSAGQAQRFLSAHDQINNLFHLRRDHVTAADHRASKNSRSARKSVGSAIVSARAARSSMMRSQRNARLCRDDPASCPLSEPLIISGESRVYLGGDKASRAVFKRLSLLPGTVGSNLSPSSGESSAKLTSAREGPRVRSYLSPAKSPTLARNKHATCHVAPAVYLTRATAAARLLNVATVVDACVKYCMNP